MQKLVFINGAGNQIDLTSGNFGITNWEGLSNTSLNIQTQQVPFEDGGVFLDALMEQREIEVTVAIQDNNNLELRYQLKRELISALNPKLGEGTLIYTNDYLSRQIKAVPQIPLFENKNSNDAGTLKASVAFSCPSPYWEDVEENTATILGGEVVEVENNGDVDCQVEMKVITSFCKDITIKNQSTGKYIKLNGEYNKNIDINTNMGQKGVTLLDKSYTWKYGGEFSCCASNGLITVYGGNSELIIENEKGKIETYEYAHSSQIKQLYYQKGFFYGVYYSGIGADSLAVVIKSFDGIHWVEKLSVHPVAYPSEIGNINFIENQFIISDRGKIYVSNDLESFTEIANAIPNNKFLVDIIFDGTNYIGYTNTDTSSGSKLYKSTDLENWTEIDVGLTNSEAIRGILYERGNYLICGAKVRYSTDLATWNEVVPESGASYYGCVYYDNTFVLLSQNKKAVYKSENLEIWEKQVLPEESYVSKIFVSNNAVWCIGVYRIVKSFDLTNWTLKFYFPYGDIIGVVYKDGLYIFLAIRTIIVSRDLVNFEVVNEKGEDEAYRQFTNIEVINGKIIVVSQNTRKVTLLYSDNGYDWSKVFHNVSTSASDEDIIPVSIAFDGSKYYVGVTQYITSGTTYHRPIILSGSSLNDFNSWTETGVGTARDNLMDFQYFGGLFVMGFNTSSGGITTLEIKAGEALNSLTSRYTLSNDDIRSISYRNKTFVFVTFEGKIIISRDCEGFAIIEEISGRFQKVRNFRDCLIAVGYGAILTSVDGQYWNKQTDLFSSTSFKDIAYDGVNFLICGIQIIQSYDVGLENKISSVSNDSDINFNLKIGKNVLELNYDEGLATLDLKYRQKYIGV